VVPIAVYDARGQWLGRILPQQRYWVPLDRIPPFLQTALLAVEDANFYGHGGLDVRGIARALLKDAVKGRWAEGGSTITQQLIKNRFLSGERSLDRKLKEARLALDFEKQYSKGQILEMYFNEINFGNGAVGLAQAARLYFNKGPEALTDGECLLLAGVPKNPGRYNPMGEPEHVGARRDVVLKRLVDLNVITPRQREAYWAHPAQVQPRGQAPHYLAYVRTQLAARYGPGIIEQGGLDLNVALDPALQREAERALQTGVRRLAPGLQGALVCLDPATGDVLAAVGDAQGLTNGLNRAFVAQRQPGSAIKPLIYAAALDQGIPVSSLWDDTPVSYDRGRGALWTPQNDGRERLGQITLGQALAHSSNVVTVKLLERIGLPFFVPFAACMGVTLNPEHGLALALGADEVTLKDLVQAYTPFAAGGTRAEARTILRIHDRRTGAWTDLPPVLTPALAPDVAFLTTRMLREVLRTGTAKGLAPFARAHPAAGKTGTTDAGQDAWFIGYTPRLLTGVWVGCDRPRPGGRGFTGGAIAAPIWERFMTRAVAYRPAEDFPQPDGLVPVRIDPANGLKATEGCPAAVEELFRKGTEPDAFCPLHGEPPTVSDASAPPPP
jgi:membrane peptidoglycan carboxypeptidase